MFQNKFMTVVMAAIVSALGQAVTFGTYDYFKEKGYRGWQAGALTGGILGGLSGLVLLTLKDAAADAGEALSGCISGGCGGLAGVTLTALPKTIGYLTAQQLNGITVQELNGITVAPIGGFGAAPQYKRKLPVSNAYQRGKGGMGASQRFRVVA